MQRLVPVCLLFLFAARCGWAGPVEISIMAMMRLSDQPNYAWVATVSDDARTYDIHGKTERGGFTQVKMPVINSVRRQLGRSVTDTQIDLIFRGNVDCVIETESGWKKLSELPARGPNEAASDLAGTTSAGSGSFPTIRGRGTAGSISRPTRGPARRDREERNYSNLQLGISHPHEELGVIVGSHVDFKVEGDVVTGTLNDLGAQLLLVRDGQENLTPLRARGSFKIWLRDGMVTKYQVKLEGTLQVQLPTGRKEIEVHQVTDTVLKDVGTTKIDIPPQARAKLGA